MLGKKIAPDEYYKYQYQSYDDELSDAWGEPTLQDLNEEKFYFGIKIDKNRLGERNKVLLFQYNLNFNEWKNIGLLYKRR